MGHPMRKTTNGARPGAVVPLVVLILSSLGGCGPRGAGTGQPGRIGPGDEMPPLRDVWPPRAVWVPREVYPSPQEIADLMEDVRQAGLNTVLFQVRGNGTAFYRSRIEPFAYEYGADPGFDPLAVACREAHRRGLAIHAWVNVMPAWRGTRPPRDSSQLYNARPEWFWYDRKGKRQRLGDFYVSLNPCLPEVRAYLVGVFEEIVRGYPVDGLHLDYIRFVQDESGQGRDYPRDRRTLELYRRATGLSPDADPARWRRWRTAQVSRVVYDIRRMMRSASPRAALSAAVIGDRGRALRDHFQDPVTWLRRGYVDAILPMAYRQTLGEFRGLIDDWRAHAPPGTVIPGIGIYNIRSDRSAQQQIDYAYRLGNGFALFAYSSLLPSANPCSPDEARRRDRRLSNLALLLKQTAGRN